MSTDRIVVMLMAVRRRVSVEVMMDNAPIVMLGLVRLIRMQVDERRRHCTHLQAETHEQHEAEAFHLFGIVAYIPTGVKDAKNRLKSGTATIFRRIRVPPPTGCGVGSAPSRSRPPPQTRDADCCVPATRRRLGARLQQVRTMFAGAGVMTAFVQCVRKNAIFLT